ncbi:MAG: TRAP transporter TatT component family protein [Enhygromyxa sp.]
MNKRSLEFAALALALTVAGACKGRTAAWEEKPKTPASSDAPAASGSSAMEAGKSGWEGRAQGKDNVLAAIAGWEAALGCTEGTTSPAERCAGVPTTAENAEMLAMLTRAYYFTADSYLRAKKDKDDYLDFMNRAVWWGERALVAASPEFAEKMRNKGKYHESIGVVGIEGLPAMYWYATALGKWARASGFGVLVGQKDNIKATMTRALELDPNYYHGGPHRYFGAFYAVAPGFAGGDPEKSKEHYQKSLEIAPYFLGTKVLMAENLATKLDDEDMFDQLLQEVLDADLSAVPEEIQPEMMVEKEKAQELMRLKDEEDWF